MERFLNHLGLYMVTETECGTTEHLQLFTLITSLVFMELLLIYSSVTCIMTEAFSHPKTTGMILSSELAQCFSYIITKMQFTFSWKPKAKGTVQVWEFYLQVKGSNGEKGVYREKELCEGLAWQ